jgi:hypothetical protein
MAIVKVQRPISTNDPSVPWLIYDRARTHMEHRPESDINPYVKKSMGEDFKAFFRATWFSVTGWALSERVKGQNW